MRKIASKLKNHFLPHKGNDHEPHFLRHKSLTIILVIIIVVEIGFLLDIFVLFKKESFLAAVLPSVLTDLTNQARNENGLPTLKENELLKKSAQAKADDMASKSYFAHTSPEGITPWYWLNKTGYKYSYAGENLAVNFFESSDVAKAWMASPTHRANIVRKEFTEIGIATANGVYGGRQAVFVVQFFGKPAIEKPKVILTEEKTKEEIKIEDKKNIAIVKNPEIKNLAKKPIVLGEEIIPIEITETEIITNPKGEEKVSSQVLELASSPRKTTNRIFSGILAIVLIILIIFIWKSEKKHPEVILRSLALIFVILILMVLNQKTLNIDTKLPDSSTINTIAS